MHRRAADTGLSALAGAIDRRRVLAAATPAE